MTSGSSLVTLVEAQPVRRISADRHETTAASVFRRANGPSDDLRGKVNAPTRMDLVFNTLTGGNGGNRGFLVGLCYLCLLLFD